MSEVSIKILHLNPNKPIIKCLYLDWFNLKKGENGSKLVNNSIYSHT